MSFSFSADSGPLLFSWWHPRSASEYFLSLVVVLLIGACAEWVSTRARPRPTLSATASDELTRLHVDESPARRRPPRAMLREGAMHTLSVALHFAIMLLAMTFNAGVFAAVVLGVAMARTALSR